MPPTDLNQAHRHCNHHRYEIISSEICACFYCFAVFKPEAIEIWVDEQDGVGQTAVCPMCFVDAVIGSSSRLPLDNAFLKMMHEYWFS